MKIEYYSFYINENPLLHNAVEGLFVMSFYLSTFLGLPNADGMKADTAIMLNIKVVCLVCHNRIWLKMSSYSMFLTIKFVSITRMYFFIFYEYIFIFHIIIDKR